jgi:hypothetical protein
MLSYLYQNMGSFLALTPLAAGFIVILIVVPLRYVAWQEPEPPEPEKLDVEIATLESRLAELEALPGTPSWQTTALTWRTRRRLAELKKRRLRFLASAKKWEARAKGICKGDSLPRRPYAVRPSSNGPAQP